MKIKIITLLFLFSFTSPTLAQTLDNDFRYLLDIIQQMKSVIQKQKNDIDARKSLSLIKNATPFMKDGHYRGHQVTHGNQPAGFISIKFHDNKASLAIFSTPILRTRNATKHYKAFHELLQNNYRQLDHNQFDLGDEVVAYIKKKPKKVYIDVYRNK